MTFIRCIPLPDQESIVFRETLSESEICFVLSLNGGRAREARCHDRRNREEEQKRGNLPSGPKNERTDIECFH
ncbi:hypothetical protein TNCT_59031 [Trichonephila clavata]|uniref:Uncharacterized protein n=1 Tax=Trichonephila clavata TaxID=2740835 RepID=A0A8X6HEH6_TRICU|nr:hypothetical protein TNCT_59031 [Trichonephila clavata]